MSGLFQRIRWLAALQGTLFMVALATGACDDDDGGGPGAPDGGGSGGTSGGDGGVPPADGAPDGAADTGGADLGPATTFSLTILHTNDLHSHLQGHGPEADYSPATVNDDETVGGFARLAAAIGGYKVEAAATGREVLLLDGGDFMMGTLFQVAGTMAAAELSLMQAVGYDAVAMGNHELDWTPAGFAAILQAAVTRGVTLPVLASNLHFSPVSTEDDTLEALADPGPLKRKFVKTLPSGLKVGFFGLLGSQAQAFAPTARPLTFDKIEVAAAAMVTELRTVDKVDLVIALSHAGIGANGKGEDLALAQAVPGIDVIVSGHTHEKLVQPVVAGKTIIVTAGSYGEYLGRLAIDVTKQGGVTTAVTVAGYNLLPIDDKIPGSAQAQAGVDQIIAALNVAFAPAGLAYAKTVAETAFDLPVGAYGESGLGDLITDAYLTAARAFDPDPTNDPTQFAVEVNGQIRAPLLKGKTGAIWFADLFRVTPLGIGPDRKPGAPLVTYYLNGADIRAGMELAAAARDLGDDVYTMQIAGLQVDVDAKQPTFQRVKGMRITTAPGAEIDITDTTKCYKVVTTLYLAGLFGLVESVTMGQLKVQGKQQDCVTPITLLDRLIDANPLAAGVQELKPHEVTLAFIARFPDSDANNVPDVPAGYATPAGRLKPLP